MQAASSAMAMQGTLFKYGPKPTHLAFLSTPAPAPSLAAAAPKYLIAMGGLTEGFLYAPYITTLAKAAGDAGWTLVQAQLSSSYQGFGCCSLDGDADELDLLVTALALQRHSSVTGASEPPTGIALLGHSTGSQITVRYLQRKAAGQYAASQPAAPVVGAVLQAAVSDREFFDLLGGLEPVVKKARRMLAEGKGDQIVERVEMLSHTPMTAARMVALCDKGGDDDMFSSDLTEDELQELLAPAGSVCPVLVLQSGADEYVPAPAEIPAQAERLAVALSKGGKPARAVVVARAKHNLEGAVEQGVAAVVDFLQSL